MFGCSGAYLPVNPLPTPDHIVIVFFENHSYHEIIDSTEAPYIKSLSTGNHSALFDSSFAEGHPSQPNYLKFFSGSTQGVVNNDRPPSSFTTPNLGAQLIEAGKSFYTYSEGLPYEGFDGDTYGYYVRKHNPAANWMGPGNNQLDSSTNKPFTDFPTDFNLLPTVCFVIPDLINSMHDAPIKTGDDWLKTNLDSYIDWAKNNNSLLILTFDESSYISGTDHITTIICGEPVKGGIYSDKINHYYFLRTIEDMYDLKHAGNAIYPQPIVNCWR
ncbi:MAG: alkaline phosphatase family protein [Chitinophagales bacterium]